MECGLLNFYSDSNLLEDVLASLKQKEKYSQINVRQLKEELLEAPAPQEFYQILLNQLKDREKDYLAHLLLGREKITAQTLYKALDILANSNKLEYKNLLFVKAKSFIFNFRTVDNSLLCKSLEILLEVEKELVENKLQNKIKALFIDSDNYGVLYRIIDLLLKKDLIKEDYAFIKQIKNKDSKIISYFIKKSKANLFADDLELFSNLVEELIKTVYKDWQNKIKTKDFKDCFLEILKLPLEKIDYLNEIKTEIRNNYSDYDSKLIATDLATIRKNNVSKKELESTGEVAKQILRNWKTELDSQINHSQNNFFNQTELSYSNHIREALKHPNLSFDLKLNFAQEIIKFNNREAYQKYKKLFMVAEDVIISLSAKKLFRKLSVENDDVQLLDELLKTSEKKRLQEFLTTKISKNLAEINDLNLISLVVNIASIIDEIEIKSRLEAKVERLFNETSKQEELYNTMDIFITSNKQDFKAETFNKAKNLVESSKNKDLADELLYKLLLFLAKQEREEFDQLVINKISALLDEKLEENLLDNLLDILVMRKDYILDNRLSQKLIELITAEFEISIILEIIGLLTSKDYYSFERSDRLKKNIKQALSKKEIYLLLLKDFAREEKFYLAKLLLTEEIKKDFAPQVKARSLEIVFNSTTKENLNFALKKVEKIVSNYKQINFIIVDKALELLAKRDSGELSTEILEDIKQILTNSNYKNLVYHSIDILLKDSIYQQIIARDNNLFLQLKNKDLAIINYFIKQVKEISVDVIDKRFCEIILVLLKAQIDDWEAKTWSLEFKENFVQLLTTAATDKYSLVELKEYIKEKWLEVIDNQQQIDLIYKLSNNISLLEDQKLRLMLQKKIKQLFAFENKQEMINFILDILLSSNLEDSDFSQQAKSLVSILEKYNKVKELDIKELKNALEDLSNLDVLNNLSKLVRKNNIILKRVVINKIIGILAVGANKKYLNLIYNFLAAQKNYNSKSLKKLKQELSISSELEFYLKLLDGLPTNDRVYLANLLLKSTKKKDLSPQVIYKALDVLANKDRKSRKFIVKKAEEFLFNLEKTEQSIIYKSLDILALEDVVEIKDDVLKVIKELLINSVDNGILYRSLDILLKDEIREDFLTKEQEILTHLKDKNINIVIYFANKLEVILATKRNQQINNLVSEIFEYRTANWEKKHKNKEFKSELIKILEINLADLTVLNKIRRKILANWSKYDDSLITAAILKSKNKLARTDWCRKNKTLVKNNLEEIINDFSRLDLINKLTVVINKLSDIDLSSLLFNRAKTSFAISKKNKFNKVLDILLKLNAKNYDYTDEMLRKTQTILNNCKNIDLIYKLLLLMAKQDEKELDLVVIDNIEHLLKSITSKKLIIKLLKIFKFRTDYLLEELVIKQLIQILLSNDNQLAKVIFDLFSNRSEYSIKEITKLKKQLNNISSKQEFQQLLFKALVGEDKIYLAKLILADKNLNKFNTESLIQAFDLIIDTVDKQNLNFARAKAEELLVNKKIKDKKITDKLLTILQNKRKLNLNTLETLAVILTETQDNNKANKIIDILLKDEIRDRIITNNKELFLNLKDSDSVVVIHFLETAFFYLTTGEFKSIVEKIINFRVRDWKDRLEQEEFKEEFRKILAIPFTEIESLEEIKKEISKSWVSYDDKIINAIIDSYEGQSEKINQFWSS